MKKKATRRSGLTYFALFACGWLLCLLLILYLSTSRNHDTDSRMSRPLAEVEERFKYLYHHQPASNHIIPKSYLRFRTTLPKQHHQRNNKLSDSKLFTKTKGKRTKSSKPHIVSKVIEVATDQQKLSIVPGRSDNNDDTFESRSSNDDEASLLHLIMNSSSHNIDSLYLDTDDDSSNSLASTMINSNQVHNGTFETYQGSLVNSTTVTPSAATTTNSSRFPKLVIYLIWPYPYKLFTSINYLALDSILSVYPHAFIRLMPTTCSGLKSNEYERHLGNSHVSFEFITHQFDKYIKLGYDVQYCDNEQHNYTATQNDISKHVINSQIRRAEESGSVCHVDSLLLNSVGRRIACLYTNKWLFLSELNLNDYVPNGGNSPHHTNSLNSHTSSSAGQYPYHLVFFLALTRLWKTGGIFTDLNYYFQHPITSSPFFTNANYNNTGSGDSRHKGFTNTSDLFDLRLEGGYHINFHCQKKATGRTRVIKQKRSSENDVRINGSASDIHSNNPTGKNIKQKYSRINSVNINNNGNNKRCMISSLLVFQQPRNPIVMCMMLNYQTNAQFIYCIEHDMFYGGANCILSALGKCFDKHNRRNILFTTYQQNEVMDVKNPQLFKNSMNKNTSDNAATRLLHTSEKCNYNSTSVADSLGNRVLSNVGLVESSRKSDNRNQQYLIEVCENDADLAATFSLPLLQLPQQNYKKIDMYSNSSSNNGNKPDGVRITENILSEENNKAVSVVWLGSLATSGKWFPNIKSLPQVIFAGIGKGDSVNIDNKRTSVNKLEVNSSLGNSKPIYGSCETTFICSSYSSNIELLKYVGLKQTSLDTGMESAGCGPTVILTGFKYSGIYALAKDLLLHPQILMPLYLPRHIQSYLSEDTFNSSSSSSSLGFTGDVENRVVTRSKFHYSLANLSWSNLSSTHGANNGYSSAYGGDVRFNTDVSADPYESSSSLRTFLHRMWSYPYIPANQPQPFISLDISPNYATDYLTPFLLQQDHQHINTTDSEHDVVMSEASIDSNNIASKENSFINAKDNDTSKTAATVIKYVTNKKVIFVISRPVDRMYTEYINSYLQIHKSLKITLVKAINTVSDSDTIEKGDVNKYNINDDNNKDTHDMKAFSASNSDESLDIDTSNLLDQIDKALLLSSASPSSIIQRSHLQLLKQRLIELQIKYRMLSLGFDELVEYGLSIDNKFGMLRTLLRNLNDLRDGSSSVLDLVIKYYYQQNFKNDIVESMFMHSIQFPSIVHYQQVLGKENVFIAIADESLLENTSISTDNSGESAAMKGGNNNHDDSIKHKISNSQSNAPHMSAFLNASHVFGHMNFLSNIYSFLGVCPLDSWNPTETVDNGTTSMRRKGEGVVGVGVAIIGEDAVNQSSSSFQVNTINDSMLPLKQRMSYEMLTRLNRFFKPFICQLSLAVNMNLDSHWSQSQGHYQQDLTYEAFNTYSHHLLYTANNKHNVSNERTWFDIEDEEVKLSEYHSQQQHDSHSNAKTDDTNADDDVEPRHNQGTHHHDVNADKNNKQGLISKLLPKASDKKEDNGYNTTIGMLNVFG